MNMSSPDEQRSFLISPDDMAALKTLPIIKIGIGGVEAMFLMAALQLVCRHPDLTGPVRETAEEFARGLQERLSVNEGLTTLCAAGWDPEQDVPVEKPSGLILPGDPGFAL